jgi:hypothetical protein
LPELDRRSRRLGRLYEIMATRLKTGARFLKAALCAGGGALAGISQVITSTNDVATLCGWSGVALGVSGAVWILYTEENAPKALEEARRAIDHARVQDGEMERLKLEVTKNTSVLVVQGEQQRRLIALVNVLREGVERAIAESSEVSGSLQRLLEGSCRPLLGVMDVEGDERWTVTVYRLVRGRLRRVAGLTADRIEPSTGFREWKPGEGWAGVSFATQHEIILPDAQTVDAQAMMHVPAQKRREDDGTRYRSVAVVPVRVAGTPNPWGVVISTSDRRGRFDNDLHSLGAISAQAIRLFAGMTALVAAAEISRGRPVAGTSAKG